MSIRTRKRKLEGDNDAEIKEYNDVLSDEFRDEMATMWEIPQIFHFLHMSKEVLHISHLSMYEMERMFAMPRASKQLANVMTCLLSPPLTKAKMRKVPPMPYDFWVNVLTHKVKGWFKVYQSKHQDIVKVLEAIGVEPDFWRIFPDASIIDEKDFDRMNFKERVWIVKTLCDTIMHSRKTVHDEVVKQSTEEQCEVILGTDRHGAKYFWFPVFLNNDLRVYRHCLDNTILSTVKPPPWKEGQTSVPKPDKHARNKRKRSRWKNGALPRERRRSKKQQDDEVKESGDSALGSLVNEDTNLSGISGCSNNNNIPLESMDVTRSRSASKTSSSETGASVVNRCSNPKSSGYDTNTSSDAKSVNGAEGEEMFRGFGSEIDNENSLDAICSIKELLDGLTSTVSELVDSDENPTVRERTIAGTISEHGDDDSRSRTIGERNFDSDREIARTDSGSDDLGWSNKCSPRKWRTLDEEFHRDRRYFTSILGDLSVSSFELVADSLESLRDLVNSLLKNEAGEGRTRSSGVPRCEMILARTIEELVDSLTDVEPTLKESVRKARTKLQREWTNFNNGVVEDQDTSGNVDHGSNRWILGSQGCPLPPTGEGTLRTLSELAVSPSGTENGNQRSSSVESDNEDTDDRTIIGVETKSTEDEQSKNKCIKSDQGRVKIKNENGDSDENSNPEDSKEEFAPENRRVLRRRGISSYTEQFSSDDEEAYELEEWPRVEAVNATPGTSDGTPAVHAAPKTGHIGDESDEKDSDQDWILPGSRKRKNKRSPANRKSKPLQQKLQTVTGDSQDSSSNLSPQAPAGAATSDLPNQKKTTKDTESQEAPPICKTESVHSELDIKDEGPIFDCNRSVARPINVNQNYVLQPQDPPAPPSVSYTVVRPAAPPVVGILTPVQPSYYLHGPQHYYSPPTDPRYIQYAYPPVGRGTPRYPYPLGPPPYQPTQNYIHYQAYPPMPPGPPYPGNGPPPSHPAHSPQRNSMNSQRHQVPSTTLYGARSPIKPALNRMPVPRPVSAQSSPYSPYRGTMRPRGAVQHQQAVRWYPQRGTAVQAPPGTRMPRPTAPKLAKAKQTATPGQKTTSLILLSDSDDEIEMIVPDKQSAGAGAGQNRKVIPGSQNRQAPVGGATAKPKPIVTSEITVERSREVLSPQMIQRMSQGGISITPVTPQQSKQKSAEASPGTKLVVVVNDTGSHYALSLPNGSKLILTPEQVAQIRASNGGKLVL